MVTLRDEVATTADGFVEVFGDLPALHRVGAEFSWFNQTYVDLKDATDYRVQGSFFFIF